MVLFLGKPLLMMRQIQKRGSETTPATIRESFNTEKRIHFVLTSKATSNPAFQHISVLINANINARYLHHS